MTTAATFATTLGLAAITLSACATEPSSPPQADPQLRSVLGGRQMLEVETTSAVEMGLAQDATDMQPVRPAVLGGHAQVRATADGFLIIEALELDLADVSIDKTWPTEHTVQLTGISFRLGTQLAIDAEWTDNHAVGEGSSDLLMDWAVRTDDGDVLPLATQRARGVVLTADVAMGEDGTIRCRVDARVDGQLWQLAGIEVHDLTLAVNAIALER